MRKLMQVLVGVVLFAACDRPLAVSPTKAMTPGLSVCWREPDSGDEGTDRALRLAMGKRLEQAGYVLTPRSCDLGVDWGYTTKGRDYDMAFRTARLSVRGRGNKLLEHRDFEFGPSDLPIEDPDRLAIVLVNAVNASTKVASLMPTPSSAPTQAAQPAAPPDRPAHGRLPADVIQRIVREHFPTFKRCYEIALRGDPTVHGRTSTEFVIGRNGHVASSVDVETNSTLPRDVRDCVADRMRFLEFPPPDGGVVTVIYPLVFSPGQPDADADAGASQQETGKTPPQAPDAGLPFDRSAAAKTLADAARAISSCGASAGPKGEGHVTVRFAPSGQVEYVNIDPPFAHTPEGVCIEARFDQAHVPAFNGQSVTVGKSFRLN